MKREARKELRKIRKGKIGREEYIRKYTRKRIEYKEWCDKELRYEKEKEEKIRKIGIKEEAWKYINKHRKKREKIDEGIDVDVTYYRTTGPYKRTGTREKVRLEERKKKREEEERKETEDISKEELIKQIEGLRKGKTPRENSIENETWRLMPKEIGEEFWKLINKIWKEGKLPEDWKRGVICPIF